MRTDWDNDEHIEPLGKKEPPILKDPGEPDAGRDGYTVVGRRLRGDMPGDIRECYEADEIEAEQARWEGDGGTPSRPFGRAFRPG